MNREWFVLGAAWLLLTAAGVTLVLMWPIFPTPMAEEAEFVDRAMTFLTTLSVPVFSLVVVLLVYSAVRFRTVGPPTEDGPPIRGHRNIQWAWLLGSLALTLFLAGYGTYELLALRNHGHGGQAYAAADELVVQVDSSRWFFEYTYPAYDVRTREALVLPVGRRARFEITARDVVHSFWVPAFRVKIDAVPGLTTTAYATPNKTGTFQEDENLRVQCAELCGVAHGTMATPVNVVEPAAFEAWVAQHRGKR